MTDTARDMAAGTEGGRIRLSFWGGTALLVLAVLLAFYAGRFPIAPGRVVQILFGQVFAMEPTWTAMEERIVTLVRGPRVVLACACGAGLAICGAAMQGIFRNPLASPQVLGVSSGASFGGALAILAGLSGIALIASAFATGIVALVIVGAISRLGGKSETTTVVLAGMVVGTFFSALVSVVQLLADPGNSLPAIVFWLMGSFASASWERVATAVPVILAGMLALWMVRFRINVLSIGDQEAASLGVNVERDRWLIFLVVALVVAATVSVAGVVGWVGLVVPHIARLIVGQDHKILLPTSCILGAAYLCLVDTLARSVSATEIPLGVITALVGAPVVAILLRRIRRQGESHS